MGVHWLAGSHRRWVVWPLAALAIAAGCWMLPRWPRLGTPSEALDALVAALKSGDGVAVRHLATEKGYRSLAAASAGYVEPWRGLGAVIDRDHLYIRRDGWLQTDASHAYSGVAWRGGSGRHSDAISMVMTANGWQLDLYERVWDR